MIVRLLPAGLVAMLLAPSLADVQSLLGTYTFVKFQLGDHPMTDEELEELKDDVITIEEDKLSLIGADGAVQCEIHYVIGDEPEEGTFKVAMEIVNFPTMEEAVGLWGKGLVKTDGTEVTLIAEFGGKEYPESFEPKISSQGLLVLKKVPAGGTR